MGPWARACTFVRKYSVRAGIHVRTHAGTTKPLQAPTQFGASALHAFTGKRAPRMKNLHSLVFPKTWAMSWSTSRHTTSRQDGDPAKISNLNLRTVYPKPYTFVRSPVSRILLPPKQCTRTSQATRRAQLSCDLLSLRNLYLFTQSKHSHSLSFRQWALAASEPPGKLGQGGARETPRGT